MGAAGVSGIPHAFIIDAKGIIRHHGHPMEPKFSQILQQVRSGHRPVGRPLGQQMVEAEAAVEAGVGRAAAIPWGQEVCCSG